LFLEHQLQCRARVIGFEFKIISGQFEFYCYSDTLKYSTSENENFLIHLAWHDAKDEFIKFAEVFCHEFEERNIIYWVSYEIDNEIGEYIEFVIQHRDYKPGMEYEK
jgi:hypothetical protein